MIGIEQNRWSAKNSLGIIVITLNNLKEMKKFFRKKNNKPTSHYSYTGTTSLNSSPTCP